MENKNLNKVYKELVASYFNLRAEVLLAELFENSNADFNNFEIANKGVFSRPYRRDIIDYTYDTYSTYQDKILLNLARNGLYDLLPQGLFHELVGISTSLSYKEIRQKHKQEEKEARVFFAPLENEFFNQKVQVTRNEHALIDGFLNYKNGFLIDFWGLDDSIGEEYKLILAQLLPFAHKIAGNLDLIAFCLEQIIGEKVSITKTTGTLNNTSKIPSENTLGVDFVLLLEESYACYPVYEIQIGPVSRKNEEMYLEGGINKRFINVFNDFFIPIEVEINLKIVYSERESDFLLHNTEGSRMGFSTKI